jgi:hypothetical protein
MITGLGYTVATMPVSKITWGIYVLFVISTLLMHLFLTSGNKVKDQAFIRKFMLATTLKLLLYLAIIVFFFLFYKALAKTFILWFLLHYVCFTVFETLMLYGGTINKSNY